MEQFLIPDTHSIEKPTTNHPRAVSQAAVMDDGIEHRATPLHVAAREGNLTELSRLIDLSLEDLDTRDENNETTLQICFQNDHIPAVELLLGHGADPNLQVTNDYGEL